MRYLQCDRYGTRRGEVAGLPHASIRSDLMSHTPEYVGGSVMAVDDLVVSPRATGSPHSVHGKPPNDEAVVVLKHQLTQLAQVRSETCFITCRSCYAHAVPCRRNPS